MKIITVAIGQSYILESDRLLKSIGAEVNLFTEAHPAYIASHEDNLINGLFHKTNFANYYPDIEVDMPVLYCDADLFSLKNNPLHDFVVKPDTDFAFVPYDNNWFFPDTIRQDAYDFFGYKINSGFMYFRNKQIAQTICTLWNAAYIDRIALYDVAPNITKYEYDEYALMIALQGTDLKIELLDKKWNDFELNTKEEILNSNSIFFQSHDLKIG